jgi:hypothetical protein
MDLMDIQPNNPVELTETHAGARASEAHLERWAAYVSREELLNNFASWVAQGDRSCLQEMDASGDARRLMSDYEGL